MGITNLKNRLQCRHEIRNTPDVFHVSKAHSFHLCLSRLLVIVDGKVALRCSFLLLFLGGSFFVFIRLAVYVHGIVARSGAVAIKLVRNTARGIRTTIFFDV